MRIPDQWTEHLAGEDPRLDEVPGARDEVIAAMHDLAEALTYPQDHHGNVIDLTYILAPLAYHLALAGARVHPDRALIRPRSIPGDGVVEGAVEWVGANTPDPEPTPATGITLDQLATLPVEQQAELLRQHGLGATPDPAAGWHTRTKITTEDDQ